MFSVIWKYIILPGQKQAFETAYGVNGPWHKLFEKQLGFRGSNLHKSCERPNTYLVVDHWSSRASYEAFKKQEKESYQQLSQQCKSLYETEEKSGTFRSI